jgi:hypothetical protein
MLSKTVETELLSGMINFRYRKYRYRRYKYRRYRLKYFLNNTLEENNGGIIWYQATISETE